MFVDWLRCLRRGYCILTLKHLLFGMSLFCRKNTNRRMFISTAFCIRPSDISERMQTDIKYSLLLSDNSCVLTCKVTTRRIGSATDRTDASVCVTTVNSTMALAAWNGLTWYSPFHCISYGVRHQSHDNHYYTQHIGPRPIMNHSTQG